MRRLPILAALLIAAPLLLGGCGSETPETAPTAADVAEGPDVYDLQTVTLSGKVAGVYGRGAFLLQDESGGALHVVVPTTATVDSDAPGDTSFGVGDAVEATGTVRRFSLADLEEEFGMGLMPMLQNDYAGTQPWLVVETLRHTEGLGANGAAN